MKNNFKNWFIGRIVKTYIGVRRFLDTRFVDRALIRMFDGVHPKNIFNFRYEFFWENVGASDIIIDVGCGTGLILSKISSRIKKGFGLDWDPHLPDYWAAFPRGGNLEYVQANFADFDFRAFQAKTHYEVCILSHVLEHIKDVPAFLKKIDAPRLLICVPSQENWHTQFLIHIGLPYSTDASHFREYTRSMLREELLSAGYRIVTMGFNAEGEIVCRAEKISV